MNKSQKLALTIGAVIAILMGLFPPWACISYFQFVGQSNPAGYSFILSPPSPETDKPFSGVELDINRLVIQWIMVAIAISAALALLHKRGSSPPHKSARLPEDDSKADPSPDEVQHDPKPEPRQNMGKHKGVFNASEKNICKRLRTLVSRATDAVFNLMLERSLALSDPELMIFVRAIKNCGMIGDEAGHLLPAFFYEVFSPTLIENENSAQFLSIVSVIDHPALDTCIHSRSICPDALDRLAILIRANSCESPEAVRQILTAQAYPEARRDLLLLCDEFRSLVKSEQRVSINPPPESPWWNNYYVSIGVFEALGKQAKQG
jgi:hypothetical protein